MSPRPNRGRTIGAEDAVAAFLSDWLEEHERSIAWLARKSTDAGCPLSTTALWKVLKRERVLRVDELLALSDATGCDLLAVVSGVTA